MSAKAPLTTTTAGSEWEIADQLIQAWITVHPKEWRLFMEAMAVRRRALTNPKFGESKDKSLREIAAFPEPAVSINKQGKKRVDDMMKMMEKVWPDIWKKTPKGGQIRGTFFKRFPVFRLGEKY